MVDLFRAGRGAPSKTLRLYRLELFRAGLKKSEGAGNHSCLCQVSVSLCKTLF